MITKARHCRPTCLALAALLVSCAPAPACILKGNDFRLAVEEGSRIAFEGDSLTYGFDNTGTGTEPGHIWGRSERRRRPASARPWRPIPSWSQGADASARRSWKSSARVPS